MHEFTSDIPSSHKASSMNIISKMFHISKLKLVGARDGKCAVKQVFNRCPLKSKYGLYGSRTIRLLCKFEQKIKYLACMACLAGRTPCTSCTSSSRGTLILFACHVTCFVTIQILLCYVLTSNISSRIENRGKI